MISFRQYLSSLLRFNRLLILPGRNYIDDHKVAIVCSARSGSTKALGTTNLLLKASSEALQSPASGCSSPRTGRNHDWTSPLHSPGESSGSRSPSRFILPNSGLSSTLTMSSIPPPSEKDDPPFFETIDRIHSEHVVAARSSIASFAILRELEEEIERDCDALRSFLMAIQVSIHSHSRGLFSCYRKVIGEMSPRSKDTVIGFGERMACKFMAAVLRDQVCSFSLSVKNACIPGQ